MSESNTYSAKSKNIISITQIYRFDLLIMFLVLNTWSLTLSWNFSTWIVTIWIAFRNDAQWKARILQWFIFYLYANKFQPMILVPQELKYDNVSSQQWGKAIESVWTLWLYGVSPSKFSWIRIRKKHNTIENQL